MKHTNNQPPPPNETARQRLRRKALEHLIGPLGSILLHLLIVYAAIQLIVFDQRQLTSEIEVQVVEMEMVELDQLEILDDLDLPDLEFDFDIEMPDLDMDMDIPDDADFVQDQLADFDFAALDMLDVQSPLVMRDLMQGRVGEGRETMRRRFGGRHSAAADRAAIMALEWLRLNQREDGSWRGSGTASPAHAAMTGLAVLTFLAHGETTDSERYGNTVRRALQFLVRTSQREDGSFRHGETGNRGGVYSQGIAAYALAEAAAMTRIPEVVRAAEKAIRFLIDGMRPDGGFDYAFVRDSGDRDRCTSVAAWPCQAFKAAQLAELDIPDLESALELAAEGMKANFVPDRGLFMYSSLSRRVFEAQTAPAVLSLQLLGHASSREARAGLASISGWNVDWVDPPTTAHEPLYIWYYANQVYFHAGGSAWDRWVNPFVHMLVSNQNEDGSWTIPESQGRASNYGPVYATTFSALSLMVHYRYLPTFQPIEAPPERDPGVDDVRIEII